MRRLQAPTAAGLATALLAVLAGCGVAAAVPLPQLRIMVPNASGSGYDITARNLALALEDAELAPGVEVFNLPGAGGTVGLQRLIFEAGNGKLMMVMGLGLIGAQYEHRPGGNLQDTTPIARLLEEPNAVVVRHDSPYQTLEQLIAAWFRDPGGLVVGGGSRPGGPDHQAPMLLAKAIGIEPREVRYEQYDGGGRLLPAIVSGDVDVSVTGLAENAQQYASGQLRVLAVTGERRVPGIDAPTLREAGVDVVFANWRGLIAPPALSEDDQRALRETVAQLHASAQWRETLATNGWIDAYQPSEEFGEFLARQVAELEELLTDLGLP
jgi:putative tricarboxylic transport membrane protein